jgi:hypothetical protein
MKTQIITERAATSKIRFRTYRFNTIDEARRFAEVNNLKIIDIILS